MFEWNQLWIQNRNQRMWKIAYLYTLLLESIMFLVWFIFFKSQKTGHGLLSNKNFQVKMISPQTAFDVATVMFENPNISFVLRACFPASFLCIDPQLLTDLKTHRSPSNLNFEHSVILWVDKRFRVSLVQISPQKTGGLGT